MELKVIDLFRKNNSSITFGVIPNLGDNKERASPSSEVLALSAMKCDLLAKAAADGVVEVALHGYSHENINPKVPTEFAGLDYQRQVARIAKGKGLLVQRTGATINTFIPPWNQYDINTLRALKKLDFSNISAGLLRDSVANAALNFLPETCGITQLPQALKAAQGFPVRNPLIIAVFHLFEIKEINAKKGKITFREFSEFVNRLGLVDDICMVSIGQATEIMADFGADRFMLNKQRRQLTDLLPIFLRPAGSYLYQ